MKEYLRRAADNAGEIDATVDLRGLGVSFVDAEPKEVMYFSILNFKAKYANGLNATEYGQETYTCIDLQIQHMQIDNQIPNESPNQIILAPEAELVN